MKRVYYTTTEYVKKIESQKDHWQVNTDGGRWHMFRTKNAALDDADWMKRYDKKLAKKFGGPKVVKITLVVCK